MKWLIRGVTVVLMCLLALSCNGKAREVSEGSRPDRHPRSSPGTRGATCARDTECRAPLRCVENTCEVPQAMSGKPGKNTPRVIVQAKHGKTVPLYVELAVEPEEMTRGLMFRDSLAAGWGMLFLYEESANHSFWMKNTYIPLDMIFIDSSMTVVGVVEQAEPLTTTSRTVDRDSQYVLEVAGGFCREHGIDVGSAVSFENVR